MMKKNLLRIFVLCIFLLGIAAGCDPAQESTTTPIPTLPPGVIGPQPAPQGVGEISFEQVLEVAREVEDQEILDKVMLSEQFPVVIPGRLSINVQVEEGTSEEIASTLLEGYNDDGPIFLISLPSETIGNAMLRGGALLHESYHIIQVMEIEKQLLSGMNQEQKVEFWERLWPEFSTSVILEMQAFWEEARLLESYYLAYGSETYYQFIPERSAADSWRLLLLISAQGPVEFNQLTEAELQALEDALRPPLESIGFK